MPIEIWRNVAIEGGQVFGYSSQDQSYPAVNAIGISALTKWRTTGKTNEYIGLSLPLRNEFRNWGSWKQYKPVSISNPKSTETPNVPVCIRINEDADIGAICRTDGYDIRFLDTDGTELSQFRQSFSVASGKATGEFWVMIPILPAAGKTIYCIYGNPAASDVSQSSINPDILLDGDFEQWASATNLEHWVEGISGNSSVNREGTEKTRGDFSCRLDVDSNNSSVNVYQNFLPRFQVGKKYKLSFQHKCSVAEKTGYLYLMAYGSPLYFWNFVSQQWQTNSASISFVLGTEWARTSVYQDGTLPPNDTTSLPLTLARSAAASSSIYLDDAKIFRADSYDACDIADASWYEQANVVAWGQASQLGAAGITHFGLLGTNLTDSATITVLFSPDEEFTSFESVEFSGADIKNKLASLGGSFAFPYVKILFADSTNPDGYISIGQIWLAWKHTELAPLYFNEKLLINDIYTQSYGFAGFRISRPALKKWYFSLRLTSQGEYDAIAELVEACGTTIPFRVVFRDYPAQSEQYMSLCRLEETPEINLVYVSYWTAELNLVEVR